MSRVKFVPKPKVKELIRFGDIGGAVVVLYDHYGGYRRYIIVKDENFLDAAVDDMKWWVKRRSDGRYIVIYKVDKVIDLWGVQNKCSFGITE